MYVILNKIVTFIQAFITRPKNGQDLMENPVPWPMRPEWDKFTSDTKIKIRKDFIKINRYSRPGTKRKGVLGIEVHWIAAPNRKAGDVRSWWTPKLGAKRGRYGSTQFIVDIDGSIIQFIPEAEIAYSSGARAKDYKPGIVSKLTNRPYNYTVSTECCHLDWDGKMSKKTYDSLLRLLIHLCRKYKLTENDLYLHYDIMGKDCHKFFVAKKVRWTKLKNLVKKGLK